MTQAPSQYFNPCLIDENEHEQIPAKIWELLRRNRDFRQVVDRLSELDAKERNDRKMKGKYHGKAWQKSWRLVERVTAHHPFAGVALQWLVPEPLFQCCVRTWPRGTKWKQGGILNPRILREGEGVSPNIRDKNWVWCNPEKRDSAGHLTKRGPHVHWTTSRSKPLRSPINPILEWSQYRWPFTVDHSWPDAPAGFRREFQFIWRSKFDCRPTNPLTRDRNDSPAPHETSFFKDWNLMTFQSSGQMIQENLNDLIRFRELADNYRVFAVPKTILTKGSAKAMGDWMEAELKKGSNLYGDLLKGELLDESELLGLATEWDDWLNHESKQTGGSYKSTYFYRRRDYMESLVSLIYPQFNLAKLLSKPAFRARNKKYVRKGRNE